MQMLVAHDYEQLSQTAADLLMEQVSDKPGCVLALAAGETPKGLYHEVSEHYREAGVSFARVATFNLGELGGLVPDDSRSLAAAIRADLLDNIDVRPENTFIPDVTADDLAVAAEDYEEAIEAAGGIDFAVVGLGRNGHVAFDEPSDAFEKETHVSELTVNTREAFVERFGGMDNVPTQALTVGMGTLMTAKKVLILVSGEEKAQAVREAFFGPVTPRVPASILQFHPDCTLIADEDAFSACSEYLPDDEVADDDDECCHGAEHEHGECCGKHIRHDA
jgi:glucosamine-6-phosphate deaminase